MQPGAGRSSSLSQERRRADDHLACRRVHRSSPLTLSVGRRYAITDGSGDPAAVKSRRRQVGRQGRQSDLQDRAGRHGGLVHLCRLHPLSAECLRCHGPDGLGSTYAPALIDSMKHLSYTDFYAIVAGGKKDVSASQNLVMPANGDEQERHVLHRRDLRLSARACRRRRRDAAVRQARAEAGSVHQGRRRVHGLTP